MSTPIVNVPGLDREQWLNARDGLSRAGQPCTLAPKECLALDGACECNELLTAPLGPCPADPAPEFRVDRSDGYGANVTCLAGDRVAYTAPTELRSADAIELGEALIAAGRYLQEHA